MSKIHFFYIYTIGLFSSICVHVECGKPVNVGTVLFTKMDLHKPCWSSEDIALLTSRMIFEDLLPNPEVLHINCDDFVDDLVCYFKDIIELIRQETTGRNKYITLLALTDLLGGYLYHAVLPNAKYAFYAGLVKYDSIKKLLMLFEELKWFLRTNGEGWAKPMSPYPVTVSPLQNVNSSCQCNKVIYFEEPEFKREAPALLPNEGEHSDMTLPLPFFDCMNDPQAIAVPLTHYSLRNIESKKSSYLLMKYYLAAYNCLQDRGTKKSIERFQNNFYSWICANVLPKLKDERFYSAFGGILRVEETLKQNGAQQTELTTEMMEEGDEETGMAQPNENDQDKRKKMGILLWIMIACIILWFVLGALFICYKIRRNRGYSGGNIEDCRCSPTQSSRDNGPCECSGKPSKFSFLACRSTTSKTPTERTPRTLSCSTASDFERVRNHCYEEQQQLNSPRTRKQSKSKGMCNCGPLNAYYATNTLHSIAEMCEVPDPMHQRRKISFLENDSSHSSSICSQYKIEPRKGPEKNVCVPSLSTVSTKPCKVSAKSSKYRSSERNTENNESSCPQIESSSSVSVSECYSRNDACHASLTGEYVYEKPKIFGYDFHTTSSESDDDIELDTKTSSSK